MGKLYPPILEGTLPAFYSENGIVKITIPFSMNRAVSYSQITGFELKIKTIQSGTTLYITRTYNPINFQLEGNNLQVIFYLEDKDKKLKIGQFYKLQLAYINIDSDIDKVNFLSQYYQGLISLEELEKLFDERKNISYYSDISIAKYTTKPFIYINDLREGFLNSYTNRYIGYYEQIDKNDDQTEKVFNYRFDIYDSAGNIIQTTGDCLHNASLDTNINFSQDIFYLNREIEHNKIYYIQYTITTTNKLTLSTPKYKLIYRELIDSKLAVDIKAKLNFNNGYIDLIAKNKTDDYGLPSLITGAFVLLRSDEDSSFTYWEELYRFKLNNEALKDEDILYRDYTIIQGKHYLYALQQYNDNNLYSNKIYSNKILADFEDAFLYDGKIQLKIKYNPKISKFTNTRLEQKIDTIGSKYPFIFRNGSVNYHEFPISGLISYFMDEEHLFLSEKELLMEGITINYTTENIAQERLFKMKVLEWLNNGQPKIFRSPEEGNFIVRLLKVSLTPEDKLGRLLHTFNCSAYEIAEFTHENLYKLNFINPEEPKNEILNWATVELKNYITGSIINQNNSKIQTVRCEDMTPGEIVLFNFKDGGQEQIVIGITGNYYLESNQIITSIIIPKRFAKVEIPNEKEYNQGMYYIFKDGQYIPAKDSIDGNFNISNFFYRDDNGKLRYGLYYRQINKNLQGMITYSYYTIKTNDFENITNVTIGDCSIQQFIGQHNILKEITHIETKNNFYEKNPKIDIVNLYSMIVRLRPVEFFNEQNSGVIKFLNLELSSKEKHPFTLYYNVNPGIIQPYFDFTANNSRYSNYQPYIILNGEKINITHETTIDLKQFDKITSLESGNGVVVELIYQIKTTDYKIEEENPQVKEKKQIYLSYINNYIESISKEDIKAIALARQNIINSYKQFIIALQQALLEGS